MRTLDAFIDRDEVAQIKAIARMEAERCGIDPELAAAKAAGKFINQERTQRARFVPAACLTLKPADSFRDDTLAWVCEANKVVGISQPKQQTPGQKKRFIRNQAVYALVLAGFPHRSIALIFDLPRSRIAAIFLEMRGLLA